MTGKSACLFVILNRGCRSEESEQDLIIPMIDALAQRMPAAHEVSGSKLTLEDGVLEVVAENRASS
jgi:hypothetical protein